jgi:hypothetical protein
MEGLLEGLWCPPPELGGHHFLERRIEAAWLTAVQPHGATPNTVLLE